MMKVNLFDNAFAHTKEQCGAITATYLYPPKNIEWVPRQMVWDGITIFTEDLIFNSIVDEVKSKIKIAWLIEPRTLTPYTNQIETVESKFDYILTYDPELLKRGGKYIKYIVGQSRVTDDMIGNYNKDKNISLIASGKSMTTGHSFRHQIANSLATKHNLDLWGWGFGRPFNHKTEPLANYKFSVAVMNSSIDNFFTEVLLDCFRLKTIPIFWGCPNIGEYFDVRGMEIFYDLNHLDTILSTLKPYEYYLQFANENFELCKQYIHTDDHIASILEKL